MTIPRVEIEVFQLGNKPNRVIIHRVPTATLWDAYATYDEALAGKREAEEHLKSEAEKEAKDSRRLKASDVQWIVNDNAELGVKIGDQFFFLYKGDSLTYDEAQHDDGSPMHWRTVGKREFGECAHPINHQDYSKIGTVSLDDCDRWQVMQPRKYDR